MDIKKAREDLRKGKTIYDMPLKVVYYARVSTDKDDQLNSLENQQNYFEEMIAENKNWKFIIIVSGNFSILLFREFSDSEIKSNLFL